MPGLIDDELYLRRGGSLTTTAFLPATILVPAGSSTTRTWINGTAVPSEYNWTIPPGQYTFTFWMRGLGVSVIANVTFTFGYIKPGGEEVAIATVTRLITLTVDVAQYFITAGGGSASIPPGSKLFIRVAIGASGIGAAIFYYDGARRPTNIVTPAISPVVPELPLGFAFLMPTLLSAYFIFKKHFEKR